MRIAMTGNPNPGKTTIYNAPIGRSEHVGNRTGVTVDKKEHPVKENYYEGEEELVAMDLPGAYSMFPFTSEESIMSSYVKNEHPDVIVDIVDATNLSKSLFFTIQLLEPGIPVVVALNETDISAKKDTKIDEKALLDKLGCPAIKTIFTTGNGSREVMQAATSVAGRGQKVPYIRGNIDLTDKKEVGEADRKRLSFVNEIVPKVEVGKTLTKERLKDDVIDIIVTRLVWGLITFAAVMWLVFYIPQSTLGTWLADTLTGWIETFQNFVVSKVENASPISQAILADDIIGGVGAVADSLPLVTVMHFLIALLEDCGYMARATVVLDLTFKRVGLSGKSVISMVIGTGCGVSAIMACRTIKNERGRRATAMLCTFMPYGAKLPVIAFFAGASFSDSKWVGPVMYLVGTVLIPLGALSVEQITGMKYRKSFSIMELPEYKVPSVVFTRKSMLERGKAYIIKAGTITLAYNMVVQIMATFTPGSAVIVEDSSDSTLAMIAPPVTVLLIPIVGFASWQLAVAAIIGFIVKENVAGTLATAFCITNFIDTDESVLVSGGSEVAAIMGLTKAAALAYLVFNLFIPPCFVALGAMDSEMKSGRWFAGAIGFQLVAGYVVGSVVYQAGTLITTGSLGVGFTGGLIAVLIIAAFITCLCIHANKKLKAEHAFD